MPQAPELMSELVSHYHLQTSEKKNKTMPDKVITKPFNDFFSEFEMPIGEDTKSKVKRW